MIKIFVGGLPGSTTEESLTALFSEYGTVRGVRLQKDIFTGACRGFATVDMEGHEARAAIDALNGMDLEGKQLRVGRDKSRKGGRGGRRR